MRQTAKAAGAWLSSHGGSVIRTHGAILRCQNPKQTIRELQGPLEGFRQALETAETGIRTTPTTTPTKVVARKVLLPSTGSRLESCRGRHPELPWYRCV